MKIKKTILSFLKDKRNLFSLILFIITTIFFLYRYFVTYSWDLSVYFLNGLYFFGKGVYFEVLRPPLTALIIGLFTFISENLAIILFIIFTSFLYFISIKKISKTLKFDFLILYILAITPFVLLSGLGYGTELLGLVFLILCLDSILKKDIKSGFFLGLAFLTRYNNFIYLPLLVFHKNVKDIIKLINKSIQ